MKCQAKLYKNIRTKSSKVKREAKVPREMTRKDSLTLALVSGMTRCVDKMYLPTCIIDERELYMIHGIICT